MPRRPSLEPKKTTKPQWPWLVELPAALSRTGRRERRYFASLKAAQEFGRQQRIRLQNYGTASTLLPVGKIEEAANAFETLEGTGASLTEAVAHFIKWRAARAKSVSFGVMLERFIENKKSRRPAYKRSLNQTKRRFAELEDQLVVDITTPIIEQVIAGMTQSVKNSFLRVLRAAFNFAKRRGWCLENPVLGIEMESLKPRRLTLTAQQVSALLTATARDDLELLPYQLFCNFAGVRPEETERLFWDHLNMEEGFIAIPDEAAKNDIRRFVEMEPLLMRWLRFYIEQGGSMTAGEPIVPRRNLRKRLRKLRATAGIQPWPQDAPRRTYASCWLAIHGSVDTLNRLMGHASPAMLFKHYNRAVTKKEAEAFWNIEPPTSHPAVSVVQRAAA